MVTDKDVERINELYHKSEKGGGPGLTEQEKLEQQKLRRAYIDAVKANLGVYLKDIKEQDDKNKEDAKQAFSGEN